MDELEALGKETITVRDESSVFEFRIPTIMDEIKIGSRMRRLRAMADPTDDLNGSLDMEAQAYLKSVAYFEVLLVSGEGIEWAWSKGPEGTRVVDSTRFPATKTNQVLRVAAQAVGQVNQFRFGGDTPEGGADQ